VWQKGDSLRLTATDEEGKVLRELGVPPGLQSIGAHWFSNPEFLLLAGRTQDQPQSMVAYSFASTKWSEPVALPVAGGFRIAGTGSDGTIYFARLGSERTEIWRSRDYNTSPALMLTLAVHCYNQSVMVSADGRRVVCNVTTSEPDAWLLDLRERN
jgi:hypothetical protein